MASDLGGGTVTLNAVSLANLVIPVTGIPSAEWFGAASAVNGPAIFPVSITTAEVFGTVTIGTLTGVFSPAGIASGEALGTVTLRTSATLSPSGVASAEALGTVTLHTSTVTLLPSGVASGAALGTATLAAMATVSPTGVPSAEALGAPTFSTTVTLSPTGIASAEALGTVTLHTISLLNPTGVASGEALGAVTLVGGGTSIAVTGIPSSEAAGDVAILIGSLSPGGIASEEALGTVTLTFPTFLSVAGILSAEAVGAPVVTPALTLLKPVGVPSAEALGTPALALQIFLAPSGIASEEGLGAPTITEPITLTVVGIASGEAFGVFAFSASAALQPSGIATAEAFGFAVLTAIGKPINPLPPAGDSFATQWEDIYQQCCDVLLETVPLSGMTLTEENFFKIAGEVLADFCSRTGMVKKIFCTRLVAGTAQYDEGDQAVEVQSVIAGQTYLDRESGFSLDNTDAEWRSQYAQPESYREDQIPANTIELSPVPNLTGNRVAMATGGYGVLSTVTAGEFSETTSTMTPYAVGTPFAFGGNPYVETINPGYGVRATKVPSTGNLQMFATALPYNITGIDRYTYVELIGSTWTPYLKYGILAKIFSSDSELKDELKANYCNARFLEGINLAAALMDTFTG